MCILEEAHAAHQNLLLFHTEEEQDASSTFRCKNNKQKIMRTKCRIETNLLKCHVINSKPSELSLKAFPKCIQYSEVFNCIQLYEHLEAKVPLSTQE